MSGALRTSTLIYCNHCSTPLVEVTPDGWLVFKLSHHGQRHTSMIRITDLLVLTKPGEAPARSQPPHSGLRISAERPEAPTAETVDIAPEPGEH